MHDCPPTEFDVALDQTPAERPMSTAEQIERIFHEHDIIPAIGLIEALDGLIDALGYHRAAYAMHELAQKIPADTAAGIALRRVLSETGEPVRDAAARAGVSHVAVIKAEKRIRKWTGYQATHL